MSTREDNVTDKVRFIVFDRDNSMSVSGIGVVQYEIVAKASEHTQDQSRMQLAACRLARPTPEWVGWTVTGPSPAEGYLP